MELQGKRIAMPVEDYYHEHEFWYPYYRLLEAGAEVVRVGTGSAMSYHSKTGLPVDVDKNADQLSADEFDGMVVAGGYAPDLMRRYPALVSLVTDIFNQGKPVAGICHAGWLLASAGIVKGKQGTCFFSIKDDLVNAGMEYLDQEVVVDGNLITSRMPTDLPAFMRAVLDALK